MNPSFKPPTPVSDRLRTTIWERFVDNPEVNSVRALAERYGLSLKRIDAILRLKGMEQSWIKVSFNHLQAVLCYPLCDESKSISLEDITHG